MRLLTFRNHAPVQFDDCTPLLRLRLSSANPDFGQDIVNLLGPGKTGRYLVYQQWAAIYDDTPSYNSVIARGTLADCIRALDCDEWRDAHNTAIEANLVKADEL